MDTLKFRQSDSVTDSQMIFIALLCVVLIILWFGFKRYAASRNLSPQPDRPLSQSHRLAAGQVLHQIHFQGKEYLVLESRHGMIQLDVKDVSGEV